MIDVYQATRDWALASDLKVWSAEETGSTNSEAKTDEEEATAPGPLPAGAPFAGPSLYLAARQTQGRGRGSHTWTTPLGSSLLSTWSFALAKVPQPIFSALVGLALFEAAQSTWPGLPWNLKAPNDLFLADKKTAGILIETIDSGARKRTVIGVGFNAMAVPAGVDTATCLAAHLSDELTDGAWRKFLNTWIANLKSAVLEGRSERLTEESAARLTAALQLHPLLKEPLLKVDSLGQLHFASRTVYWHEL